MAKGNQKDGRRWSVDSSGIKTLKRKYQIELDAITAANGEGVSFTGVPAIGSKHPAHNKLVVDSYEVEEGEGSAKNTLNVTVNYEQETTEEDEEEVSSKVEAWGWDASTEEREMTAGADGTPVLNSAGDVFDRVPTVSVPAPVFTKVVKFESRQSSAMNHLCKVNSAAVTIGGRTFPVGSLLCTVAEQRVIGEDKWKYKYTIQLKYRTNPVKLFQASTLTDVGWDVAITDAGMRELDPQTGKLSLIKAVDTETGKKCVVTSPELLNGAGKPLTRNSSTTPSPWNMRFQAYERTSFPSWFYSEPT